MRITGVLQAQREVVTITREDSRVARAISWLLETQQESGAWGTENIAATATVMLALAELATPMEHWQIATSVKMACDRGGEFLRNQYFGKSWEHTIWDTAMTVRALCASGRAQGDVVERQVTWLGVVDARQMRAKPHHLAQRLLAFVAAGASANLQRDTASELIALLGSESTARHSPYMLGQVAEALRAANLTGYLRSVTGELFTFLRTTSVDSANFVNICAAVRGLSPPETHAIEEDLRTNVASLFGDSCFRIDGTWYHDPTATAWALLALTPFSHEVVIRAPKGELMYQINDVLDQMGRKATEADRHDMRSTIAAACTLALGCIVAASYVACSSLTTVDTWIDWAAPSASVVLIGFTLRSFRQRLRRTAPPPDEH